LRSSPPRRSASDCRRPCSDTGLSRS
jgi:hypothetical protein